MVSNVYHRQSAEQVPITQTATGSTCVTDVMAHGCDGCDKQSGAARVHMAEAETGDTRGRRVAMLMIVFHVSNRRTSLFYFEHYQATEKTLQKRISHIKDGARCQYVQLHQYLSSME